MLVMLALTFVHHCLRSLFLGLIGSRAPMAPPRSFWLRAVTKRSTSLGSDCMLDFRLPMSRPEEPHSILSRYIYTVYYTYVHIYYHIYRLLGLALRGSVAATRRRYRGGELLGSLVRRAVTSYGSLRLSCARTSYGIPLFIFFCHLCLLDIH